MPRPTTSLAHTHCMMFSGVVIYTPPNDFACPHTSVGICIIIVPYLPFLLCQVLAGKRGAGLTGLFSELRRAFGTMLSPELAVDNSSTGLQVTTAMFIVLAT